MLDSRAPPAQLVEEEKQRDEALESEISRLQKETRMWRVANSAQWVAWGIVQAKVPGMEEALNAGKKGAPECGERSSDSTGQRQVVRGPLDREGMQSVDEVHDPRPESGEEVADEEGEEEFDYLGYAQERALLFWGDVLQMGIVKREELPEELLDRVKVVAY